MLLEQSSLSSLTVTGTPPPPKQSTLPPQAHAHAVAPSAAWSLRLLHPGGHIASPSVLVHSGAPPSPA